MQLYGRVHFDLLHIPLRRITADVPTSEKLMDGMPKVKSRYKSLLADLRQTLLQDIAEARECLKMLLGVVKMVPQPEGYLAVELQQNFEGLFQALDAEGRKV